MIALALATALAVSSSAAVPPAVSTAPAAAPVAAATVSVLAQRFIEATDPDVKTAALNQIAKTTPASGQDVAGLFDLFSRFTDKFSRDSIMSSLARLAPGSPQLEPIFMTYLRQPEPEAQLFGINGAFRLRARAALPIIHAIAERKFAASTITDNTMMSERNAWWTQYEALSVLAQWEGDKAYALLDRKGEESARVGDILGRYYWRQTLPKLRGWYESGNLIASERAVRAAGAPIDMADARATREQMMKLFRDPKTDGELRHLLALKIGACSNDDEAAELAREHDTAKTDGDRLYWAAAAFASRSPKIVPLLARYASQNTDETMRKGAMIELTDIVGADEARKLTQPEKKK